MKKQTKIIANIILFILIIQCLMPVLIFAAENSEFTYIEKEDGTIEITGYEGNNSEIQIPSTIEQKNVTSIASYAFYSYEYITKITIPNSVEEIGTNAFYSCTKLEEVNIPNSVTKIEGNPFVLCSNLQTITVEEENPKYLIQDGVLFGRETIEKDVTESNTQTNEISNEVVNEVTNEVTNEQTGTTTEKLEIVDLICYPAKKEATNYTIPNTITKIYENAFNYANNLTSITIASSVTEIGDNAFYECDGLESITIPRNVTTIGLDVLALCSNLKTITVEDGNEKYTSIDGVLFEKEIVEEKGEESNTETNEILNEETNEVINEETGSTTTKKSEKVVKLICYPAKKEVTEYSIPETIISIQGYAFYENQNITKVTMENQVVYIGSYSFSECINLKEVELSNSISQIKEGTFYNCYNLEKIDLASNITSIDDKAFYNCKKIAQIDVGQRLNHIGWEALYGCESLTTINLPTTITYIGNGSFKNCSELASIIIPYKVEIINESTFENCSSLEEIVIPNGVTNIGYRAFYGCSSLEKMIIPKSVTSFGYQPIAKTENLVISCSSDSAIYTYAIENNITVDLDDVNPTVTFETNGDTINKEKFIELKRTGGFGTKVTITDNKAGIDSNNTYYCWTHTTDIPSDSQFEELTIDENGEVEIKQNNVYASNASGNWYLWIKVLDRVGNTTVIRTENFLVDTIEPQLNIVYNPRITMQTEGPVTVTIYSNEQIKETEALEGWINESLDKMTWTKVYEENTEEEITLEDLLGNSTTRIIRVTNIMDKNPTFELSYSIDLNQKTNQPITVTLTASEEIEKIEGWFTQDNIIWTKTYEENTQEQFYITDLKGNQSEEPVIINIININTEKPIVNVIYTPEQETSEVMVRIIMESDNKKIQQIEGWKQISDITLQKQYTNNVEEKVIVKDDYGNETEVQISIRNIIDKEIPAVVSIEKSTETLTNENVVVTVTMNEQLNELDDIYTNNGWTLSEDRLSLFKEYTENSKEKIKVKDLKGNLSDVIEIEINNIDKQGPKVVDKIETPDSTIIAKSKTVTIIMNEELRDLDNELTKNGWILSQDRLSMSKKYTQNTNEKIVVYDLLGNQSETIEIIVKQIDNTPPKVNMKYDGGYYKSHVLTSVYVEDDNSLVEDRLYYCWSKSEKEPEQFTKRFVNGNDIENILEDGIWYLWIKAEDKVGNISIVKSNAFIIDSIKPEVKNVEYDTKDILDKGIVIVTVTMNEEIRELDNFFVQKGWKLSKDKLSVSKEYTRNDRDLIVVYDLAGNEAEPININVEQFDGLPPTVQINYSQTEITNQNVVVTITTDRRVQEVAGWTISQDGKTLTKKYTRNTREIISLIDMSGNRADKEIVINNIDKESPITQLNYSELGLTRGPVIVTITANEPLQELKGWTLSEAQQDNKKIYILTKSYENNVNSEVVEVKDIAGNSTILIVEIVNIDFSSPKINKIEYSQTEMTNKDVRVTITMNERIQELEGWELLDDTVLTKTYDKNVKEEIVIKDIIGNEIKTEIIITNIDKESPKAEIQYSTKENTKEVLVTLTTNEQIKDLNTSWAKINETTWTKRYIYNVQEVIELVDIAGNKTVETIIVENIDYESPKINIVYSTSKPTNQNVEVRLEANEKLAELNGWILSEDKRILTKTYNQNIERELILVYDIAGNETEVNVSINNIDKQAPLVKAYSEQLSPRNAVVTIVANEELQDMSGWNKADSSGTVFTKYFYNNTIETMIVKDLAGNETKIKVEVLSIEDIKQPEAIVKYSTVEKTKEDVIVQIIVNEQIEEVEGWLLEKEDMQTTVGMETKYILTKTYSENAKEVIQIKDLAGNIIIAYVEINNIDKVEPVVNTYYSLQQDTTIQVEIQADEEIQDIDGWRKTNNGQSLIKNYTKNVNEIVTVKDLAGNEAKVLVIIKEFADVTPPSATVSYSTEEKTKSDIEVTITVNEQVQQIEGWQLQKVEEGKYTLKKIYTENIVEDIILTDLNDNTVFVRISIDNIDKQAPIANVVYSNENPTNQNVVVNIEVNEQVNIVSNGEKWTIDGNKLTKEYETNEKEEIILEDLVGNQVTVLINVTNIDKEIPILQVQYSGTEMTNKDVIVTMIVNEEPREIQGWQLSQKQEEGQVKYILTKSYSKNIKENIVVYDLAGNSLEQLIEINNIDKKIPTLEVIYSTKELTKGPITVTINSDEEVCNIDGWTLSQNIKQLTKTYYTNKEETIIVKDLVGNETKIDISIRNIEDNTLPIIVANYSTKNLTNQNVTVSLVSNKQLRLVDGWNLSEDKKILTKEYENNIAETIKILDLAGNQVSVQIQIDNIDKQVAQVNVNYSVKEITKGNVTVTLKANEKIQELQGWETVDEYTLKKIYVNNIKEDVVVKDIVGNETKLTINVQNIDKVVPTINVEYSTKELTNGNVEVKLIANEKVQKVEGWNLSEDKKVLSKIYETNTEGKINVLDLAGNTSTVTIKINNIDKIAPITEVDYSTKEENQESIIVTITANEKIQAIEGWTLSKNQKQMTKIYYKNKKEIISVKDLAGNLTKVQIEVTNIINTQHFEIDDCEINEKYIYNLKSKCTKEELVKRIQTELNYKIYNAKGNEIQDKEFIGTGSKVVLSTGELFTFVIKGDLDSDGNIGINDLLRMKRQIIGMISLKDEYKEASDFNSNKDIDLTDLLLIKKAVVGMKSL